MSLKRQADEVLSRLDDRMSNSDIPCVHDIDFSILALRINELEIAYDYLAAILIQIDNENLEL